MALTYTAEQTTLSSAATIKSPVYSADERFVGIGTVDQTIDAGRGNDRIEAGGGDDKAEGGEGDDYVDGGSGDDDISGGRGKDLLVGGSGDDILRFDRIDFIDDNGRGTDGGPGLQGRLSQGSIYDGGSGFDLMAVRNAGGNSATDGSAADTVGFERTFQFSTASNRDIRGVEGIVVDHADDKGKDGHADLVKHSLGEIRGNAQFASNEFVAYLASGDDTLQFNDRPQDAWALVDFIEGADDLDPTQISQIAGAGRFGSDTGKIVDLLDTYVFQNGGGQQAVVYTDAEDVVLNGVEVSQDVLI